MATSYRECYILQKLGLVATFYRAWWLLPIGYGGYIILGMVATSYRAWWLPPTGHGGISYRACYISQKPSTAATTYRVGYILQKLSIVATSYRACYFTKAEHGGYILHGRLHFTKAVHGGYILKGVLHFIRVHLWHGPLQSHTSPTSIEDKRADYCVRRSSVLSTKLSRFQRNKRETNKCMLRSCPKDMKHQREQWRAQDWRKETGVDQGQHLQNRHAQMNQCRYAWN